MTRWIDADRFLRDMAALYLHAGWDANEVHFSLNDLDMNLFQEYADTRKILVEPTKWTPVGSGLPKPFKEVLITFKHKKFGVRGGQQVTTVGVGFHNGKDWASAQSSLKGYKVFSVLAWAPKPEPYREEE